MINKQLYFTNINGETSILDQHKQLPIYNKREVDIVDYVKNNCLLIIIGIIFYIINE